MNVNDHLQSIMNTITSAERKVATVLLADYPFAGLLTVAELSGRASVSGQTILRLASKLGFDGYGDFQSALINELKEAQQSPIALHEAHDSDESGDACPANIMQASIDAIRETFTLIPPAHFDVVGQLLSAPHRSIYLMGGRFTGALANYCYRHLRLIRKKVYMVPSIPEDWPEYLITMNKNDILIMFDNRRYQPSLLEFARHAEHKKKIKIVLITDKWLSPISKISSHVFPCSIDVGTPWDTGSSSVLVIETLINKVSEENWIKTKKRIEDWEALLESPSPN